MIKSWPKFALIALGGGGGGPRPGSHVIMFSVGHFPLLFCHVQTR